MAVYYVRLQTISVYYATVVGMLGKYRPRTLSRYVHEIHLGFDFTRIISS
jgi:hypothetical protein